MRRLDERILESLNEEGSLTAWQIAFNLDSPSRKRVVERCKVLAEAGFVEVVKREELHDQFEITGCGQRYLTGEVNAELRRPVPGARPPQAVRPGWYAGFG